ncbi:Peptidase_C39 like family protein [Marvinbryantia formatexigens]|nr:Peptidase_C39 like family protein [Marvinbryantia formatexigens]
MKIPVALCVLMAAFVIYAEASKTQTDYAKETAAQTEVQQTELAAETEEVQTETETEDLLKDYPESLVAFMEKYPEATQFVLDYPKYKDVHNEIDISGEVKKGELPLFLQWDVRWGYERYGSDFLAVTGCGPTCLSMVQCGLSGETIWNPYEVAKMAEQEGYYVNGEGSSWDLMSAGAEKLGLQVYSVTLSEEDITDTLRSGKPVICSVRAGDFTDSGHFIVLAGVNADGSIKVNDPNSRINSEKSWDIGRILPQIKGMWAYSFGDTEEEETLYADETGEGTGEYRGY